MACIIQHMGGVFLGTVTRQHDVILRLARSVVGVWLSISPVKKIIFLSMQIQQVDLNCLALVNEVHLQGRKLKVIHGHVIGQLKSKNPELEKTLIEEYPSLVIIEFGKLMGFRLVDLFSSLDKDGSRTLDKDEIRNGLKVGVSQFVCFAVVVFWGRWN